MSSLSSSPEVKRLRLNEAGPSIPDSRDGGRGSEVELAQGPDVLPRLEGVTLNTAFANKIVDFRIGNDIENVDPDLDRFLQRCRVPFLDLTNELIRPFKVYVSLSASFVKESAEGNESETFHFTTHSTAILQSDEVGEIYDSTFIPEINKHVSYFGARGSGWALKRLINMDVHVSSYRVFTVGAAHTKLPAFLFNRKACVNIECPEQHCFLYAVMAGVSTVEGNVSRATSYPNPLVYFNTNGLTFPSTLHQIKTFERNNDISINVYACVDSKGNIVDECFSGKSESSIQPLRVSSERRERHVNILAIRSSGATEHLHFVYIKSMSRLLHSQLSKTQHEKWICERCLQYLTSEDRLNSHNVLCSQHQAVRTCFPTEENKYLQFTNFAKQDRLGFIAYCDTECYLKPFSTCLPGDESSSTTRVNEHVPYACSILLVCGYDSSLTKYVQFEGDNCIAEMIAELVSMTQWVCDIYSKTITINTPTPAVSARLASQTHCHICQKVLAGQTVLDHCHFTGEIRGYAHSKCNLAFRMQKNQLVAVYHNLQNYDAHFLMQHLVSRRIAQPDGSFVVENPGSVKVLGVTMESYKCITKYIPISDNAQGGMCTVCLRFIDSLNFLNSSLETLAGNLTPDKLKVTRLMFPDDAQFQLATRKGVFPYDFVKSSEQLQTASLPPKEAFHNVMSGTDMSDLDYTHAQKAWDVFHCATLKEYALSYLKVDTCLLADIFESFRFVCLQYYSLDPAHYITAPSLAWDALLFKTGARLELITDPDIYLFLESAVRGGITNVSRRHAKANNVHMSTHDPCLPSSYICYFDVNALYAHTMLDKLPVGKFEWVPRDEYASWDFNAIDIDGDTSYFAEVDLTFPDDCHDRLSDLPLAPVNGVPPNGRMSKLLLTLVPRNNYVVHAKTLRHYVRYGAVIGQVHRVLRFEQAAWMKDYITFNAERRAQAANPFEKSFFKLLSNAVYGKSLEDSRKHRDIRIASCYESIYGVAELIGRPTFKARQIVDENLVLI
ncbi:uncharacterized protein LOC134538341 [Bacillus rossius redtenbacheri]|uniref:uncharacterized protein LOC134538341 n=1 Tax=Bacillus rossius redtenbacheri TaxID=93214 RepID=UPI002FDCAF7A